MKNEHGLVGILLLGAGISGLRLAARSKIPEAPQILESSWSQAAPHGFRDADPSDRIEAIAPAGEPSA